MGNQVIKRAIENIGHVEVTDLFMRVIYGGDEGMVLAKQPIVHRAPVINLLANAVGLLDEGWGNAVSRAGTSFLKSLRGENNDGLKLDDDDDKSNPLYEKRNRLNHSLMSKFPIFGLK